MQHNRQDDGNPDCTVAALEWMSPERIERHVQRAYALGSRYIASVCPSGNPDPEAANPVQPVIERWYWPHPVSAPLYLAKRLALSSRGREVDRTYVLGWKRLSL